MSHLIFLREHSLQLSGTRWVERMPMVSTWAEPEPEPDPDPSRGASRLRFLTTEPLAPASLFSREVGGAEGEARCEGEPDWGEGADGPECPWAWLWARPLVEKEGRW